jgi:hypothetical protein
MSKTHMDITEFAYTLVIYSLIVLSYLVEYNNLFFITHEP